MWLATLFLPSWLTAENNELAEQPHHLCRQPPWGHPWEGSWGPLLQGGCNLFTHTFVRLPFLQASADWSGQMSNYWSVNKIFCLSSFSILLMWEYLFGVNGLHFLLWHLIVYYLQLGLGIARELLLDFNRSFLLSCVNQRNILYVFFVWSKQCSLLFLKLCTYFIMSLHDICF